MNTKCPNLENFLIYDINDYILPDVKRLREEVRPDPDRKALRGCTVPTGMFAFAILDLVGFLMRPEPDAKREETTKNITFILSSTAGLFPNEYEKSTSLLIKLFRHGLMHQVFPKASGVAKIPKHIKLPLVFYQPKGLPNLNVDKLADDLIIALTSLEKCVKTDDVLAYRMEQRIAFLIDEDFKLLEEMRQKGLVES